MQPSTASEAATSITLDNRAASLKLLIGRVGGLKVRVDLHFDSDL